MRFKEEEDTLPLFTKVYTELKKRDVQFGDESTVKVWEGVPEKQKPASEQFDEKVCRFTNLDEKHEKLKKQLDVVLENIVLANEMIDGCDP